MSQENEPQSADETPVFAVRPGVPRETVQRTVSVSRMFDMPQDGFSVDPESILAGFHDAPGFVIRGERPIIEGELTNVIGPIGSTKPEDRRNQPISQAWRPDTTAQSPCCGQVMDIVGPKTYRCPNCSQVFIEN